MNMRCVSSMIIVAETTSSPAMSRLCLAHSSGVSLIVLRDKVALYVVSTLGVWSNAQYCAR